MPTEVTSQRHSLPRHETAAKPISIDDLIDDNLLASIGWDAAARRFDLPPYHPILGWSVCPVAGCGAASGPIPGGLCSACYQRRQRQIDPVDMAGYLRQPRPWVMAPSPPYAPILDLSDLPDLLRRQMLALICVQWGSGRPQLAVVLRRTVDWLRANAVASMDDPIFRRRDQRGSVDSFRRSGYTELQIALTRPEDEKIKDVWDLRVFGYPAKRVSFVGQASSTAPGSAAQP